MDNYATLESVLAKAARRLRWQRGWRGFWSGFLGGCGLLLLGFLTFKFLPVPSVTLLIAGGLWAAASLIGFAVGFSRRVTLSEAARHIEKRQSLQERLSTALEMKLGGQHGDWNRLLVADAAACAGHLEPRKIFPWNLPRAGRWALLVLALTAGLGFVPEWRTKKYVQRQRDKEVIREVGQQIANVTRLSVNQRPPALQPVQESLNAVVQLGDQLSRTPVTRAEALKDLANVADKLKQDLRELGKNPALQSMQRAARDTDRGSGGKLGELQKKMAALQSALGEKKGDPAALDQLKKKLEEARREASGLPGKESTEGAAARQQMAQSLSELSQQARQLGESLPGLEEAIAALQANQTDLFLKDLDQALNDLQKTQELAKTLQQLQQQASKLGKDLAEQLKMGQAEAAQGSLQKMIEDLKKADLSQEQLQKILDEVKQAVDPASPYGKVAESLIAASKQMQQGEKSGAARSLADAAKELEKLMQQMSDAQSLASTLEALKKAQMCVGTAQSWAQCNRPGMGKGGRPGSGVGTWAEETGWMYYPDKLTERWDNTGINRPDMDPRGQTDRGDGQLADTVVPTKVKGQFSSGGPMPGITLKGVSIKGQSTVAFQEAATAAQNEAQSALNQDQVPKAYQNAVKNYFDDFKK